MMRKTCLVLMAFVSVSSVYGDDLLEKTPSRFAKLDNIRIHYKTLGNGKTALVFVHGWSCDMTFWDKQVPAFKDKLRVVLIDLPGHGKSDRPEIKYTMDLFAKAVDAVLVDAGVEEAVLAGHSMGTPVVRQYYRLFPRKTRGLIAVDGNLRRFLTAEQMESFVARLKGPNFKDNVGQFVERMMAPDTPAATREKVKAAMPNATQHVALSAMTAMADPAIWGDDKIEVPLQAIMANTPQWSEDYKQYVRKLAPHVDYRVMEGVSHFLMMEKPEEFNRILGEFLKKHGVTK